MKLTEEGKRSLIFYGVLLLVAVAGFWAALRFGPGLKPWVGGMMILAGLLQLTPLMFQTADEERVPAPLSMKLAGGAFICLGLSQFFDGGPGFWILTLPAFAMIIASFVVRRRMGPAGT